MSIESAKVRPPARWRSAAMIGTTWCAESAAILAKFAREDCTDAEAGGHRLTYTFACLHLDDGGWSDIGGGHRLFKHFACDRTAFTQDQFLPSESGKRRAATPGERMARRYEQHHTVRAQAHCMKPWIGDALGHDRNIGLVTQQAFQHTGGIVDGERKGEAAGPFAQRAHDRHDVMGGVRRDTQMPAHQRLLSGQQRLGFVLNGEETRRDAVQLAAGLRWRHRATLPIEQADTVTFFEGGYLARQVGLAETGGPGGGGEGAGLGDEMEGAELGGCHIEETDR